jgi:hypothetical protein
MQMKHRINQLLISMLITSFFIFLLKIFRFVAFAKYETLQFLPLQIVFFCVFLLIALNPEAYDTHLDKINLLKLPKYPQDKAKRLKYFSRFGYVMAAFCLFLIMISVIFYFIE